MIQLENVSVRVGDFSLEQVSLTVPAGGYGLVIGPTGSGKTTLLEAIAGHVRLAAGRILLRGEDVSRAPPEARRVGFVYQHYHLFPHFTVRENIGYGIRGPESASRNDRVFELAELLGLVSLLDRSIQGLSGGEQQRIALARAMAPRPSILLLDEPFAAVDPATRRALRRELGVLHEREGVTSLQVTHDFEDAMRLGDVVAVLAEGRIAQSGAPETVFRFPNSPFVAEFIGTGTVLRGLVERAGPEIPGEKNFAAHFQSGSLVLEVIAERDGPAYAVLRPADLLLSKERSPGPAPRNRLAATVVRIERGSAVAQVHLEVAGVGLTAAVTAATALEMGLAAGDGVIVSVKATAIHLI
ncbi:MAG TPA: ABC transporter ATP-binding protein [Gemmatimonadales bacterium]|nr:ABC transporter ATP-binding protein [Gemmatimonadales bacterium]